MIETQPNKTMFGKRDKHMPVKATLNNVTDICVGESVTDAKLRAQTILEDTYIAAQAPMVFRVANDGTVFCARWISHDQMEYYIVRGNQWPSSCVGRCDTSLQSYMDRIVQDYNSVTPAFTAVNRTA